MAITLPEMKTVEYAQNFSSIIKENSKSKVNNPSDIIKAITEVKNAAQPSYDQDNLTLFLTERNKTLKKLMDAYWVAYLSKHYPQLDNALFALHRRFGYSKANNKLICDQLMKTDEDKIQWVDARLFAYTPLNGPRTTKMFETKIATYTEVKVTATLPPPPPHIVLAAKKAMAVFHKMLAEAYNNEVLCDLFTESEIKHDVGAVWIPGEKHMAVEITKLPEPKDPALVLLVGQFAYLVDFWQIEDERPFEHYLREFSIS